MGPSAAIGEWIANGTKTFASYDELQEWISGPLADDFATSHQLADHVIGRDAGHRASRKLLAPLILDSADLRRAIEAEVIGQSEAVDGLARAVVVHLARRSPVRPLTMMFLGPSGTGKTLAAQTLANVLEARVGAEVRFARVDMAEYQERHSVSKLLGAPPGYVGFGERTPLIDSLSRSARVVVLFDEIEKAHPDVFTALMNLMDSGRVTTSDGETLDARGAVPGLYDERTG